MQETPQTTTAKGAKSGGTPERLLFALAIACSAFLVFLVQPMVAKRLLPWYGGAPGVWTLCLAFYQLTLFAGYAYAHGLMCLGRPRLELSVHAAIFVAAWLALPVLPGDAWRPASGADASGGILLALIANVALPFLFLSATGPLLQAWFSRANPTQAPYFLYALSNTGSLLALFAYPFVFEPNLGLAQSGANWSVGFAGVGAAVLACGLFAVLRSGGPLGLDSAGRKEGGSQAGVADVALWVALSGVAVVLLMGITNQLCLDVASVPFLWILPLAAYLLSFILCFASERFYRRLPFVIIATVALLLLPHSDPAFNTSNTLAGLQSRLFAISFYVVLLFSTCMVLHGELYRRRPPVHELTSYYLWVSAGGALGGLIVGIGAERWLDDYFEVPLGIAAWWVLVLGLAMRDSRGPLRKGSALWRKGVAVATAAFLLFSMLYDERFRSVDVVHQERSFFGVLRVISAANFSNPANLLRHGTALHGIQFNNAFLRRFPTSYYGFATGIGLTFSEVAVHRQLRVGVVGLGAGTLAAYGRPGDLHRFYEIDPAVISLARDTGHFSFLSDSRATIEIVERDGRLALEEENRHGEEGWDLLVLDAFSSDAVPVHLLTREALSLYASRLRPNGVIALHVSNRHLDLPALCFRLAASVGLSAIEVHTAAAPALNSVSARWILATSEPDRMNALKRSLHASHRSLGLPGEHLRVIGPERYGLASAPLWTDDYSDLLGILRPPRRR